jgi:hypothetical protein
LHDSAARAAARCHNTARPHQRFLLTAERPANTRQRPTRRPRDTPAIRRAT